MRRDKIVVALEHKVLVYNFADLKLLHSIETLSNPTGLLALSPVSDQTVLACPGINVGQVSFITLASMTANARLAYWKPAFSYLNDGSSCVLCDVLSVQVQVTVLSQACMRSVMSR